MKIGILTFHNAYNYGAILQAYATQKLIENLGYDVDIINYQNSDIVSFYQRYHFKWKLKEIKNPLRFLSLLMKSIKQVKKEAKYDEFTKQRLNVTSAIYKKGDKIDVTEYDAVLIGSDQVWNPKLTGGIDVIYWGNVERGNNTKIIAWSPSSQDLDYSLDDLEKMKQYLRNFSSLSVRDESLRKIVDKITNKDVSITLDPTFLIDKKEWTKLCHKVPEKDYVLVYAVRHFDQTLKIAKQVAKRHQKKVIVIRAHVKPLYHRYDMNTCSPEDFLSYIYYADYVVTSSFHGAAFSIIFEKKFINYVPESSNDSRVLTILRTLNLGDRVVNEKSSYSIIEANPDFQLAKEKLRIQIDKSIGYIKDSIK